MDIPLGYCQCGCGEPTSFARQSDPRSGIVKGQPLRYIYQHHGRKPRNVDAKMESRFWAKVDRRGPDDCWLWQGALAGKYGQTSLRRKGILAHRYSYTLAYGPIPDGVLVCHNCPAGDNPRCVNPKHLWLGSQHANVHDCIAKGRRRYVPPRGSAAAKAKLTEADIPVIRRLHADGYTNTAIAQRYSVDQSSISNILTGKSWKHVA